MNSCERVVDLVDDFVVGLDLGKGGWSMEPMVGRSPSWGMGETKNLVVYHTTPCQLVVVV